MLKGKAVGDHTGEDIWYALEKLSSHVACIDQECKRHREHESHGVDWSGVPAELAEIRKVFYAVKNSMTLQSCGRDLFTVVDRVSDTLSDFESYARSDGNTIIAAMLQEMSLRLRHALKKYEEGC